MKVVALCVAMVLVIVVVWFGSLLLLVLLVLLLICWATSMGFAQFFALYCLVGFLLVVWC